MEVNSADNLYKKCFEKYTLARQRFCTLDDFHEVFQINNQRMVINLLNIACVKGDKIRPKELWEVIHKLDDNEIYNGEFIKDLTEFSSLSYLLAIYPDLRFKKWEKPDFILKVEDNLIGLEITSAASNIEKQVSKVAKYNFGRNKSFEDVKSYINKRHPNIIGKHDFHNVNGKVARFSSDDCHAYKNFIVEKALNKAEKVKSYSTFSEMWVLIDTENNGCFTERHDAGELAELFRRKDKDLVGINKIIVINAMHKTFMFYDVKIHEFTFIKQESLHE